MARARGLAPRAARAKSLALLEQVNAVLDEYREHLPLTLRQIFIGWSARMGTPRARAKTEGRT